MKRNLLLATVLAATTLVSTAQVERIKYGDFQSWVTRHIEESGIIGGAHKTLYEVGPKQTINGNVAYSNLGGSPWATSNVYARVAGVSKASCSVVPDNRGNGNLCMKLSTVFEHVKVIGLINIDVLAPGSAYLGRMVEPVKSTKNPYSKLDMGIPFNKRPKYLIYDYKIHIPVGAKMIYASGFGRQKVLDKQNSCETFIILQRRWEDKEGNIYAKRVATGRERFYKSSDWVNGHKLELHYGNITKEPFYKPFMGLVSEERPYYSTNSKGEMVKVHEIGWDDANAKPTHMMVMFSVGCGTAYEGVPGQTMWVDNVKLEY